MKLSILIPVYNERYLVKELVRRVLAVQLPENMEKELVMVDDGSKDGTRAILEQLAKDHKEIVYIPHEKNQGKGAAIRTAIGAATGDFSIFQDADLEYDPNDYPLILEPLLSGRADVVFGSRFLARERRRVLFFRHTLTNKMLTWISNFFTDLSVTDMETCYKAFRTQILKTIPIRCSGFGMEPEITAKVAKRGLRIYEVPINYDGRTYLEGKKITWRDGYRALAVMVKFWLIDDIYTERAGHEILGDLAKADKFNRWMADRLRPFVGHKVMEIGAGIGNMTVQLQPREKYYATDRDDLYLDILKNLAIKRTNLEAARVDAAVAEHFEPFKNQVDTVVCLNVLEHIPQNMEALKNFYNVLEPGGRVIILVPQGQWLYSPLDKELEHVKRYSRKQLEQELKDAGFTIEESFSFNRMGVVGWFLNGVILRRKRMAKYQLKMYNSLVWFFKIIDPILPWHGLSVVSVARKPGEKKT